MTLNFLNEKAVNRSLVRNILSLFFLQGVNYLLSLFTLLYLVRTLGTENFGRLGFCSAFIQYFVLLVDYGFNLSATRVLASQKQNQEKLSSTFWNIMACKAILGLLGALILLALINTVPTLKSNQGILQFAYIQVVGTILLPIWFFQGLGKIDKFAACSLAAKILILPTIFFFVQKPEDVELAAALQGITTLSSGLFAIGFIYHKKMIKWAYPSLKEIKTQLTEGWHVFLSTAATSLYTTCTTVILGFLTNSSAVGHFVAADKIRQAVQGLISPISQVLYPRINALVQQDLTAAFKLIRKLLLSQGIATAILSTLLFIYAPLIVETTYGANHQETTLVLQLLAPLPLLTGLSNVFGIQTMLPLGMSDLFSRILIISSICSIIFVLPLSAHLGTKGAAISVLFTECLVTCSMGWAIYKRKIPILHLSSQHLNRK